MRNHKTMDYDKNQLIEKRQVRIFLSSTFTDMKEERIALMKSFEMLRVKANKRNVDLCVVDLRWGVTEEESRNGKTISVCLSEIERSYPFFIGMLGNHYGTPLNVSILKKNPDLQERYPWLIDDILAGRSIAEIEMLYAVLRKDGNLDASFYIKQTSDPDDNPRLSDLKMQIRQQQRCPVADYSTIEELCCLVETNVNKILDYYFPEIESSSFDRERAAQQAFINSRHAHYLKRKSYFDVIDDFVRSQEQQLVFKGESGIGKSALLANWIKENEDSGDFNLFYHFVGNPFSDNNYENILRRICDEIYNLYPIEKQSNEYKKIEDEAQCIINELINYNKTLIVVIDGIDQIVATSNEKKLLWLPASNEKVKYIFTTRDDDETMRVFKLRGYREETVTPLNSKERRNFVEEYLDSFGKRLGETLLHRIVDDTVSANTLVLKSLLDELICFGSYKQLKSRINHYLSASSISDFFDRVLIRMEDDYSANQELVCRILTLISVSEQGLTEDEIMAVLDCQERDWSLFFCAFYNHFIIKDGIISFSHQYVATAVEKRYHTKNSSQITIYRKKIVSYFDSLKNNNKSTINRRISELAYQYYHLANWRGLYKLLLNIDAFNYFNNLNQPLLGLYWRSLINEGKKYSLSAYSKLMHKEDQLDIAIFFSNIASFMQEYIPDHKYKMPLKFYNIALEIRKKKYGKMSSEIAELYNNIGLVYYKKDDLITALKYYKKALRLYNKRINEDKINAATTLSNMGLVYNLMGEYRNALKLYKKALAIDEEVFGQDDLITATLYDNIGSLYSDYGDQGNALKFFQKALEINIKNLGLEHPNTAITYNNIGRLYFNRSKYQEALEYYQIALEIDEKVIGIGHPDMAKDYHNIGMVYYEQGDYKQGFEYFQKALMIDEETLGVDHHDIAVDYNSLGLIYEKSGDYHEALKWFKKAKKLYEKIGVINPTTANIYDNIGAIYLERTNHNYMKALEYYEEALAIKKKAFKFTNPEMASSYNNIASVYYRQGDYLKALKEYRKALRLDEKFYGTNHPDIARDYNNIGLVYSEQGYNFKALDYHSKALSIRKKVLGVDHLDTASSYNNIGTIFYHLRYYPEALKNFKKALKILRINFENDNPYVCIVQNWIEDTVSAMKK